MRHDRRFEIRIGVDDIIFWGCVRGEGEFVRGHQHVHHSIAFNPAIGFNLAKEDDIRIPQSIENGISDGNCSRRTRSFCKHGVGICGPKNIVIPFRCSSNSSWCTTLTTEFVIVERYSTCYWTTAYANAKINFNIRDGRERFDILQHMPSRKNCHFRVVGQRFGHVSHT